MTDTVPPHGAFAYSCSTVPDSAAILERFFTQDQCQSLQRLFLVQQSYLFRYLYEMETHLELTLEELKRKLAKTEGQATRLLLLAETTRDGLITLSHRLDEVDSHQRRKRKRMNTTSSTHASEHATKQTMDFSSPVCSDTSTLLGGSPNDASKKPSESFLQVLLAPINRLNCDSDTDTSISSSALNFSSAPAVSSNLSPVTQWAASAPDRDVGSEPVPATIVQNSEPALSATSSAHDAPQPDLQPRQELESEHDPETEPEPQRFQSHPQFPPDDMDFTTTNEQAGPSRGVEEEDEDEDEDEEVVAMQLVNAKSCSTSRLTTPLDLPKLRVDSPDASSTPLVSPFVPLPSLPPTSPSPQPSPSSSPAHLQPHTSTPGPPQDKIPEARETIPLQAKLEPQEPAPLTLDPKDIDRYFLDLTRSLSPLTDLTDMSRASSLFAEKGGDCHVDVKVEQGSGSTSGLDGVKFSDILTRSLEEKRTSKSKKRVTVVEKKKSRPKRLDKRVEVKKEVVEQKKKSLKGPDKPPEKKRVWKQKVKWPEAYGGSEEDGFYKKLIECDTCSCWYHYGCAGIKPGDVRLHSSATYVCPVCTTNGENKLKGQLSCTRPDCRRSEQPGEYIVSGIAGRKLRYDENGNVKFLYLVKWDGYSLADATWEFEDVMPEPQNLIQEFNEACQQEGLSLDSSEPILLQEAVAVGWQHVLEFTDPPGKQVPLAQHVRQKNGYRILIPVPPSPSTRR